MSVIEQIPLDFFERIPIARIPLAHAVEDNFGADVLLRKTPLENKLLKMGGQSGQLRKRVHRKPKRKTRAVEIRPKSPVLGANSARALLV